MGVMDELAKIQPASLGSTGKTFIDADTLVDDKSGEKYRLLGINAGEIDKLVGGKYKQGTAGGRQTTDIIKGLANTHGYTNVTPQMDENGEPARDQFGRILTDLTNDAGQSFRRGLQDAGAFDVNTWTSDEDIAASQIAKSQRQKMKLEGTYVPNEFDEAAALINQAEYADGEKQLGFKKTALDEQQLGRLKEFDKLNGTNYAEQFVQTNVATRSFDRTLDNQSLNPLSDAWDIGWTGVAESSFGMLNLMGETSGWEGLADIGEQGISRAQAKLGDKAKILTDYKDVEGFSTAMSYVANNAVLSLPYMAISATGALAAPLTGGASLALPASVYAGQTWNEMEGEKNAAVAIGAGVAQAALDKLGLNFIFKKGVPSGKLMTDAVNHLVGTGIKREAAEASVMSASRAQLASFIGDAAKVAKQQIAGKQLFKQLSSKAGIGGAGEAITEAGQEATGYLGATIGSDKTFDFNELNERMIAGAIAGGVLGGAFSLPSTAYDTGAWADVAFRMAPAEDQHASQSFRRGEELKIQHGYISSNEQNAAGARNRADGSMATMEERIGADTDLKRNRTAGEKFSSVVSSIPELWRGSTRAIFTPAVQAMSPKLAQLADMFGGNLQRVHSGATFENAKHHRTTVYKNMVPIPEKFYSALNGGKKMNNKARRQAGKDLYDTLRRAVDTNGNFDPDRIAEGPKKAMVLELQKSMETLGNKMYQDQAAFNPKLGYLKNYLATFKGLNKGAIAAAPVAFQKLLTAHYGYKASEAKKLTDQMIDNNSVNTIDEAFSVLSNKPNPGSHQDRSLALAQNEAFEAFMEQDPFANMSTAAKAASKYVTQKEFIGDKGEVIAQLLGEAVQEDGVSADLANEIAAKMQDYLDAESGNYKQPQTEMGKTLQRVQKNFMVFTTLASLPLSTISSFVESALTMRALSSDQIFGKNGKKGGLKSMGTELAKSMWTAMGQVANLPQGKVTEAVNSNETLRDLGYYEWDVGAGAVTGVSEVNTRHQRLLEWYFTVNGLSGWTNYTRAVRAGMADDYFSDKAELINMHLKKGGVKTREVQEAEEALRNLGFDSDRFPFLLSKVGAGLDLDETEQAEMDTMVRDGTYNFINDAIVLPQSSNRPLIYQDPRFALFTQFQGFMATFTATQLPKMWGEYVKRGTPAMKYNAFAVMTTMIMMGFASQWLKDRLKYGESSPHLETAGKVQRGLRSSGLMGSGERVFDLFFPLYSGGGDPNKATWAFRETTDQSPALSNLKRLFQASGEVVEGNVGEGARKASKLAPFAGTNKIFTDLVGDVAAGWNFNGA